MKIVKYKTVIESLAISLISPLIIQGIKLLLNKTYVIWAFYLIPVVVFIISYLIISYFKSVNVENKISIFITNNKDAFNRTNKNPFKNIETEKAWMFIKLSDKFPQMTNASIKKYIEKHYNLIETP